MKHRVGLLLACAWCAASVPVSRAQSAPPAAQPPTVTFQVEVNYVDVDTFVTDQQGNFVRGLTRDDFELFEDGKPLKIDLFSSVDIPVERQNPLMFGSHQARDDVKSNRQAFAGRLYVIVLDDLDISFQRSTSVRRAARQFIQQNLGANDVAAVVYTSGRSDASQEFTSDQQLLLAAVDKFRGQKLRSATLDSIDSYYQQQAMASGASSADGTDSTSTNSSSSSSSSPSSSLGGTLDSENMERGFRARRVLDELRDLANFLAGIHGRRKALLLFSEGVDYPFNDVFTASQATDVQLGMRDAVAAAARSNVSFFTIDPRGLVGMSEDAIEMSTAGPDDQSLRLNSMGLLDEMRLSQDSLRSLATETGGFAAVNANNLTPAFSRIVQANSTYYVLGYYPPSHPRDGKFHKIEVHVKRPGLHVESRKGYASPRGLTPEEKAKQARDKAAAASGAGGASASTSPELRDVLNSPMQQGGLTLSVQAAPFRTTGKEASVALTLDIDPARLHFKPARNNTVYADDLELSFFSINEQGKPVPGTTSTLSLNLRPETYRIVQAAGLRMAPRINLAPGRYQLRVGVRESGGGEVGSVFYDLNIPDFSRDPLTMSGVLLTSVALARVPTPLADKLVTTAELPAPATSRRDFVQGDSLALFAEIYDNASKSSPQVDVVTRLTGEDGRDVFTARDTLGAGLPPSNAKTTTFVHTKRIDLKDVAPGRYLLLVQATSRGGSNQNVASRETVVTVHPRPE